MKNLILSSILLLMTKAAWGLVDYSEPVNAPVGTKGGATSVEKMPMKSEAKGNALTWRADYSLYTNYESMEIAGLKYGVMNLGTHIQTPFNIYFDASYWNAKSNEGSQNGNPKLILGFNWLRLGSPSDEARFDIYAGARLPANSKLGSSRTDKIVGAETTKRFGTFGLGVGFDLTMAGLPKNDSEKEIGNITRLIISGGWMVSNDIQFEVEAENFKISKSSNQSSSRALKEDVSFSTLSPKLNLGLAPAVNLELGARFRMKKAREEADLMAARVFDLHGANSNSLFAGLNFTI